MPRGIKEEEKVITLLQSMKLILLLSVLIPVSFSIFVTIKLLIDHFIYGAEYNYTVIYRKSIEVSLMIGIFFGIAISITAKILGEHTMRERRRKAAEIKREADRSSYD